MNWFVTLMQRMHFGLAWPAALWVRLHGWCGRQWERLRR